MGNSNLNFILHDNYYSKLVLERIARRPLEDRVLSAPVRESINANYNEKLYKIGFLVNILDKHEKDPDLNMFLERVTFA